MKILYHHRTRAEDAQGIHIREMVNAFQGMGHQVEVVGMISHEDQGGQNTKKSWISRFASHIPSLFYEVLEILYNCYAFYLLTKRIQKFRPDFIYERYSLYTVAGILVSKLFSIPLILEVNAPIAFEKIKYSKLFLPKFAKFFERWICSNAYKTIVVTTPLKIILESLGVPEKKMVVIPNGINPDIFNPSIDGNGLRKQLKLKGKIVVGFVGWFRKWHGLEELLRVYADYKMFEMNIHILLVGDGPAYPELKNFACQNGIIKKGVTFTGAVARKEVPKYMAAFDIAIQPNVTDYACPIKLVEYISMQKAIIAPNKPNIKEILKNDYQGLFQANDFDDMAKTIIRVGDSKNLIRKLETKSAAIFRERGYMWIQNAKKTLALLNERNHMIHYKN
jgi:glycosyltransferase involved in cell wall biosynthesis